MDWILFLHAFTIINKCLLFPLFWFKRNNSMANRLLALLILLPAIPVAADFLIHTGRLKDYPHALFIYQIFINFFGPVYYFYCLTMVGRPFKFGWKKLVHLLAPVMPVFLWIDYLLLSPQGQSDYINSFLLSSHLTWQMIAVSITPILFAMPYMFVAAWKVYQYTRSAEDVFTNLEMIKIGYIKEFMIITIGEILLLFGLYLFMPVKHIETIWVPILGNVMYFYVIYKSYNYSIIFSEEDYRLYQKQLLPLNQYVDNLSKKYSGSSLSAQKADEYAGRLEEGFKKRQWHLDPQLNLNLLAEKSGIPAHYISQIINQRFKKNFFDYVNCRRVEELKSRLLDHDFDHLKLEELAYMCGFNSKAAFQRSFKKHTGTTPSLYREKYLKPLLKAV